MGNRNHSDSRKPQHGQQGRQPQQQGDRSRQQEQQGGSGNQIGERDSDPSTRRNP
uniref:hypothetical protein n=1 Tax=Altererythrobacter segetis TaxID=1104773 RepID=UPI00140D4C98|nr:hypothetical protein [Altererythrobacter segetis]